MRAFNLISIRIVLILSGLFISFTALDIAMGGMATMGWQTPFVFFEVTNPSIYLVQDSHIRFIAGVWLAVGLLFLLATTNLKYYKPALSFCFAAIFLGGVIRASQMPDEIFSVVAGSLAAEVVGIPLLYFWLKAALNKPKEYL